VLRCLFKTFNISSQALTRNLQKLLEEFSLKKKIEEKVTTRDESLHWCKHSPWTKYYFQPLSILCCDLLNLFSKFFFNLLNFIMCKFVSKVILFEGALQFQETITLCYNNETRLKITIYVLIPFRFTHFLDN
jgi:hypothetical protein